MLIQVNWGILTDYGEFAAISINNPDLPAVLAALPLATQAGAGFSAVSLVCHKRGISNIEHRMSNVEINQFFTSDQLMKPALFRLGVNEF